MTSGDLHGDATAMLGLMRLPRVGTVTIHRILDALAERDAAPRHLLDYDGAGLVADGLLTEAQAAQFVSEGERHWRSAAMDRLETSDIAVVPVTASTYPACLRDNPVSMMPPLLTVRGHADLLSLGGVAFAGARSCSPRGLEVTRRLVARAVEQAFTVVSGGAAGTDAATHDEALARGGSTIVVLAEGILAPGGRRFAPLLDTGRAAVVSTFLPDDPWQAGRAMERNKYIIGLCDRLVVIEAGARGGTLLAGRESLKAGLPTWVLDYADPPESAAGNRLLIELGASAIPVSSEGRVTIPPELFAIEGWVVNRVDR